MNTTPLFTEGSIRLTALDPEKDAESLSRWTSSPSFVKHHFDGIFRLYRVSEVKKKMKETLKKDSESSASYYFAVHETEAGIIGLVKIGWVQGSNQVTNLFLDLPEEEHFSKYAETVLKLVLRYIFMELSLHRVSVDLPSCAENEIALYENAGFLRESQRRQAVFRDGNFHDELVYGLLRPEWKKQQEVQQ